MSTSINSILSMGNGALTASQACISTTGNNISNVNTPGYCRQTVLLAERNSIDSKAGQVGQGVKATEIVRAFDRFVEKSLLGGLASAARQNTTYSVLSRVQELFNSSTVAGIDDSIAAMFNSWNKLAQEPNSNAVREALLGTSQTLASLVRNVDATLEDYQRQLDEQIKSDVESVNALVKEIALINKEINAHTVVGSNNANALMDKRDQLVRQLSEFIDVNVNDRGNGDYYITTTGGNLLVQKDIPFSLTVQTDKTENSLMAHSPYKDSAGSGTVGFDGKDTCQYTLEIVTGGAVDGGAMFKVSYDGGRTWEKNADGTVRLYEVNSENDAVFTKNLQIWFDAGESVAQGDRFTIAPKADVYWVSPTSGPINISTQVYADGTENNLCITGGSLGAYLTVRDKMIGDYRDQLEATAQTIIWEVNRLHSQGSGLTHLGYALGTYAVDNAAVPLGGDKSGLAWAKKLTEGNMSFAIYDAATGKDLIPYPGMEVFSAANFDPATMSLEDVRDMFNAASFTDADGNVITPFNAQIVDGKLEISTTGNYTFGVTSDTTGLLAGLGINTFFTGDSAGNIAIRDEVATDTNNICANRLNGAGETNEGDNITAREIAGLLTKSVSIGARNQGGIQQPILSYYASLVTRVGADTLSAKTQAGTQTALANSLMDQREAISGVSLDEEMSNLIKFQASYKAAAKLITTADQMLQTILGLKQ